jgi:hypothetical protein
LNFVRWPSWDNEDINIPENIKMAYVKDWELACPGLSLVLFIDGSTLRRGFKNEWV